MLTTLISNLKNTEKNSKQSYFGQRWSADTGFAKNLDRTDYHFDEVQQTSPTKQLNEQILVGLQSQPPKATQGFVTKVRDESLSFLAERRGMHKLEMERIAQYNESMTTLIATLFAMLECYSVELNSYVGCTELQTICTRPQHVCEITKFSRTRKPLETITYYRARIASASWSIVIRGKDDIVEIYLIPVGQVLGLSKSESMYNYVAQLQATINENGQVEWETDGKPLTEFHATDLCMYVFSKLIENTKFDVNAADARARRQGGTDR